MKIAMIVRTFSKRGGISSYAAELAQRFAVDNEVHVFTNYWQDVGSDKIIFHKIPMLSFNFLKKRMMFAWNNIFEIWSFMFFSFFMVNPKKFDIVHSQGDFIGKFDVFTVHSCHKAWLALARSGKISLLEWFKKSPFNPLHCNVLLVEKHSLKTAKKVIAISEGIKREIIQFYNVPEEKIEIVPNGADINKFHPDNNAKYRAQIRAQYSLKPDDFVIIFPAHEFKRKGLFQIIEALNILKNKDMYVLVVGRDSKIPFLDSIKRCGLEKNIIFVGETREIEKYYATSDLFVFPTSYEAFSLATIEAAASGLPMLLTNVNGAEEIMKDNVNGFFIERKPKDIAAKIEIIFKDNHKASNFGRESRKIAEDFSWDITADKTKNVYEKIFEK